jgi:hypothetical protein
MLSAVLDPVVVATRGWRVAGVVELAPATTACASYRTAFLTSSEGVY